jgi:hypothetical protein
MSTKPQTHNGDFAHLPPVLEPLTRERRWVVWRWTENQKNHRWTKPPFQARHPNAHASSTGSTTWGTFDEACAAVLAGQADGIGFALLGSGIGAADLDHCRDPVTGQVETWADAIQGEANGAYREITVSGTGLRVIGSVTGAKTHKRFNFDRNGKGLELYRGAERYITISGIEIPAVGTCTTLPPVDEFIDTMLARYSVNGTKPGGLGLNAAEPQEDGTDYDDLIRNGVPEPNRSEVFNKVVWYFASQGWSAEKILEELEKYPNGIAAKYVGRLEAEVQRSYDKWQHRAQTSATGQAAPKGTKWPIIDLQGGHLPRIVEQAESALLQLLALPNARQELYQRGELIVRPVWIKLKASDKRNTGGWHLREVKRAYLVETMTRAARFLKPGKRAQNKIQVDCPLKVADVYLESAGKWRLPVLFGIIGTPFLREDGSICETPGYDQASGLLFKADHMVFPPVLQNPTRADALAALKILKDVISTFPFVSDADRSVALSGILTPFVRRVLPTAPLHGFSAPTAGTGKSLLVDIASVISTGQLMAVSAQGSTEEEMQKRLGAALISGVEFVSLDNCAHTLRGEFLCAALTQQQVQVRILGQSKQIQTPTNITFFATGNNLTIASDLTRRTILCCLDAKCERPELRVFKGNIIEDVRAQRGALVVAALTVLRAWYLAESSAPLGVIPLGSFEDWSCRVRNALIWLGEKDPCDTMETIRENDPVRLTHDAVMAQWQRILRFDDVYTAHEIIDRAQIMPEFYTALVNASQVRGLMVDTMSLGKWLGRVAGTIVNGRKIVLHSRSCGISRWKLVKA